MELWYAFREGGAADYLNLLLALIGLGLAIGAIAKARSPSGRVLGIASIGAGIVILGVGTLGAWSGRVRTDGAVSGASVMQSQKDRIRREGYVESSRAIDFGLGFATIPFLLGGVALVMATRRERRSMALPGTMLGVAGLLVVTDAVTLARPLPGRDLPRGDPAWHVVDSYYQVSACLPPGGYCSPADWTRTCGALDSALHPLPGSTFYGVPQTAPDLTKVPDIDVPKLVDTCRAHAR